MRIAACLSGHSRNYRENFPNFPFDVDYFVSSSMQSGLPDNGINKFVSYHLQNNVSSSDANIQDIVELYGPKIWEFLPDSYIPDELDRFKGLITRNGYFLVHIGMMFYRLYKANLFKREYERNHNFRYDFVIRSRFDVKVNDFDFNKDYLYLVCSKNKVLDLFFAGKSHIMDSISDCYLWLVKQSNEFLTSMNSAESILEYYINQLDLNVPFLNQFDITFNKDKPIEYKIIRNGIVTSYNINHEILYEGDYKQ